MLVSNQTSTVHGGSRLMIELISSCYEAREKFRSAAAKLNDDRLKRLFEIYAQQRTRFAEELREHLPSGDGVESGVGSGSVEEGDTLRNCMATEWRTLQLYKQAVSSRELPTRTHFLISSQLALLERAHERVNSLLRKPEAPPCVVVVNAGRVRA